MCGIAGLWRSEARLAPMLDALAHRGPDARGEWHAPGVALGHLRLSIQDPHPRAHQPMRSAVRGSVLAYNGELYNAPALRGELEREGARFVTRGDTEVVLWALERWGPEVALPRFDGMFALAWYDPAAGALWLARDRLGIKPLHLWRGPAGERRFASEPKGLLADAQLARRGRPDVLFAYLIGRRFADFFTPFAGIEALRPGALLRLDAAGEHPGRFADTLGDLDVSQISEERGAALPRGLEASVESQLVSDVPLAAFCSGGVDSSTITAIASELHPGMPAYCADPVGGASELPYAQEVCDHLGVELRPVPVDRETWLRLWPEITRALDAPSYHASDMLLYALAQACKRDGVKVALTGEGGDELFGGYAHYFTKFPKNWRRWQRHALLNRWRRKSLYFGEWAEIRYGEARVPSPERRSAVFRDYHQGAAAAFEALRGVRPYEERAYLAGCLWDLTLQMQNLLARMDRTCMAAGVEARVPFLAEDLIRLCIHLPRKAKQRGDVSKALLREIGARRIPERIMRLPKRSFRSGFHPVAPASLLEKGALPEVMGWGREQTRDVGSAAARGRWFSYWITSAELWARIHLRGESPESLGETLVGLPATRDPVG